MKLLLVLALLPLLGPLLSQGQQQPPQSSPHPASLGSPRPRPTTRPASPSGSSPRPANSSPRPASIAGSSPRPRPTTRPVSIAGGTPRSTLRPPSRLSLKRLGTKPSELRRRRKQNGVTLDVRDQGGSTQISKMDEPSQDKNAIEIAPCLIQELDAAGQLISPNRKFNATQLAKMNMTTNAGAFTTCQNLTCVKSTNTLRLQAQQPGPTPQPAPFMQLDVKTYDQSGTVTVGTLPNTESYTVSKGDVKLDYSFGGWSFSPNAAELEVKFCLKCNQVPTKRAVKKQNTQGTDELDIGANGNMVLSKKLKCGNTWVSMPSGYPAVQRRSGSGRSYIVIRLPVTSNTCLWDPYFQASTASSGATLLAGSLLALAAALLRHLL